MKKLVLSMILLTAAVFIYAQNPSAIIREMSGTVELQRAGSGAWVLASVGDSIDVDTIVSTGFKSNAILSVGSSTLIVRPITRLSLRELVRQNQTENININLNTGRIRVEVNPPAGTRANLQVTSPSATASVRGTIFEMDTTSVQVVTGAVSFAPSDSVSRPVTVSTGQDTVVDTDTGTVSLPMAVAETASAPPSLPGGQSTAAIPEVVSRPSRVAVDLTVNIRPKIQER